MNISFIGQGLENNEKPTGNLLIESLKDQRFTEFSCLVAFVSSSAVDGLTPHIEEAKDHIEEFNIFVGIDQEATSKEALEILLELDIDTQIYYTKSPITFHPKIYIFEGENKARVILGSSNITVPGLFQNIESSIVADFEKPDEEGEQFIEEIRGYFNSFFEGSNPNLNSISEDLIEDLVEGGTIPQDSDYDYTQTGQEREERDEGLMKKLRDRFPTVQVNQPTEIFGSNKETDTEDEINAETTKGKEVWKNQGLTATEALNRDELSKNTRLAYRVSLKQAGYEVNGEVIDQTTYFRHNIFGDLDWVIDDEDSDKEVTEAIFHAEISDEDLGYYKLEIVHNPNWESGTNSPTTFLRWGELADEIEDREVMGKELRIYEPSEGLRPFFIRIT